MATTQTQQHRHEFRQAYEKYDCVYEERPYVSGGFLFGFGGVSTTYKKDLVSYKERPVEYTCQCGLHRYDKIHADEVIQTADRLEPIYKFKINMQ
jgi:hypothetical protein